MTHFKIKQAIQMGFFLEAIALIDSVSTDRFESILSRATGKELVFRELAATIKEFKILKIQFIDDHSLVDEFEKWIHSRNRWIHEFARLAENENMNYRDRRKATQACAIAGHELLKRLIRADKKLGSAL
ncbi:MAG: hypothetical protein F2587_00860 [Actinobacteria bacterium]|nr:hypothetical protein [Actinomycetota bacterium]